MLKIQSKNKTDEIDCRVCSNHELISIELRGNKLHYCHNCGVVNNFNSELSEGELSKQIDFHDSFFSKYSQSELLKIHSELNGVTRNILTWSKDIDSHKGNFIDFLDVGAGFGALTSNLLNLNQTGYAIEPSGFLCKIAENTFKTDPDNIINKPAQEALETLKQSGVKVRYIIFWHSLEHISDFKNILKLSKEILVDNGQIIVQLPGLLKDYIYPEHLFFVDDFSIANFGIANGLSLLEQEIDYSNFYFTGIFEIQKTLLSAPLSTRSYSTFLEKFTSLLSETLEVLKSECDHARHLALERLDIMQRMTSDFKTLKSECNDAHDLALKRFNTIQQITSECNYIKTHPVKNLFGYMKCKIKTLL